MVDIEANLNRFLGTREPTLRYASFDYCFNYFQSHRKEPGRLVASGDLETSCLQLGFYLASWGMLRGSSALLWRSSKHLAPLIDLIANDLDYLWGLDIDGYDAETIPKLLEAENAVRRALRDDPAIETALESNGLKRVAASEVLTTKILLGVFGCVPAFDQYFRRGFGVSKFGPKSLRKIREFYDANAETLDDFRVPTVDFVTGAPTELIYPKAKLIDMVFFVAGS
ncbi:MAG TPA: hypothetical protein PLQ19_08170 [Aeromicrobium sp.]|nr:hypothetical protein [Aeromicrobium sp.]